jgi:hypothetical protein
MNQFISSNVAIYKMIADEAYQNMVQSDKDSRSPKSDGSSGCVITYDPNHFSFKQAMISIVFTGMWLEASMHIHIVKKFGDVKFHEYDFKPYEQKLELLGCNDQNILNSVQKFKKVRKSLVHEKAYFDDGEIKWAQKEAKNAHEVLTSVYAYFQNKLG